MLSKNIWNLIKKVKPKKFKKIMFTIYKINFKKPRKKSTLYKIPKSGFLYIEVIFFDFNKKSATKNWLFSTYLKKFNLHKIKLKNQNIFVIKNKPNILQKDNNIKKVLTTSLVSNKI